MSTTLATLVLLGLAQLPTERAETECRRPTGEPQGVAKINALTAETRQALEKVIETYGVTSKGYDPCKRPLAALSLEQTLVRGDPGLASVHAALELGLITNRDAVLAIFPEDKRAAVEAAWPAEGEPDRDRLRRLVQAELNEVGVSQGEAKQRSLIASLFAGTPSDALAARAGALIEASESKKKPEVLEGNGEAITVEVGTSLRPGAARLVRALESNGFDVIVVSNSPEWIARAYAQRLDLPPDQILGARAPVDKAGRLTARVKAPVPAGPGKVLTLRTRVAPGGRRPVFVAGSGDGDRALLDQATALALLFDNGDSEALLAHAKAKHWLIERK